jgi:acyl-CoA reductase-like NAD-dependent aldehyde dehydrogenase
MVRNIERQKVINQVQMSADRGAEVLTVGRVPPETVRGYFYEPIVLAGVDPDLAVLCEETFGPVLPVIPVIDFEQALQLANQSDYGLGATLFTQDARKVKQYMQQIEAGNVWVNDPLVDNVAGPFGGMKRSGLGRELGLEGYEEFLETKHVHWEIEGGIKSWWYPFQE